MKTATLTEKLTAVASEAFENGMVRVEERIGVLWLVCTNDNGDKRTISSVGLPKEGVRRLTATIKSIASQH